MLGGATLGDGMRALMGDRLEVVESDVYLGPRTEVVLDAHDIPFADSTFDAVVAQAVLEHVVDPYRSVSEIWRVLKPRGIVYAETPFMQQVHGGPYDFTRFTPLGHRRLFRQFEELDSGVILGTRDVARVVLDVFPVEFLPERTLSPRGTRHRQVDRVRLEILRFILGREASSPRCGVWTVLPGPEGTKGWSLSDHELLALYRGIHE